MANNWKNNGDAFAFAHYWKKTPEEGLSRQFLRRMGKALQYGELGGETYKAWALMLHDPEEEHDLLSLYNNSLVKLLWREGPLKTSI